MRIPVFTSSHNHQTQTVSEKLTKIKFASNISVIPACSRVSILLMHSNKLTELRFSILVWKKSLNMLSNMYSVYKHCTACLFSQVRNGQSEVHIMACECGDPPHLESYKLVFCNYDSKKLGLCLSPTCHWTYYKTPPALAFSGK